LGLGSQGPGAPQGGVDNSLRPPKVLGILGSPRRGGNTSILLERVLAGARSAGAETELVNAARLRIRPCEEIYACERDGVCPIKDDMVPLYPKLLEADGVVLASPIFFYGLTAQVKALIDRCQALWMRKHRLKWPSPNPHPRHGVFVSVGATRGQNLFLGPVLTAKYFFDAIDVEYRHELLVRQVDQKGEILEHPDLLELAEFHGQQLVRVLADARAGAAPIEK
jgi:multimeric flavodoxin WrbA